MAVGFPQEFTTESGRFPGWKLHVCHDWMTGDLKMIAIRRSDGRRLEYSEPCAHNHQVQETIWRLCDRLAEDFLDLVPIESPSQGGNEEKA